MTRRSHLILLVIALLLALFTTLMVVHQLSQWRTHQGGEQTVSVVVVAKAVPAHTIVDASDVSLQSVAKSAVQSSVLTSLSTVVGHYAGSQWYPGQQVISAMVLNGQTSAAFPISIPVGNRAFTIANDPVTGVDHMISAGDRIDILVSYDAAPSKSSQLLLQNVLVLLADNPPTTQSTQATANGSSGQSSNSAKQAIDTLTVALNPEQAVALDYAEAWGKLHIILRNPNDSAMTNPYIQTAPFPGH